jgi:hypothetical protein
MRGGGGSESFSAEVSSSSPPRRSLKKKKAVKCSRSLECQVHYLQDQVNSLWCSGD